MKTPVTKTVYTVRKIEKMSPSELTRAVEETTKAFTDDPTMDFVFRSPAELAQLVAVNFRYYLACGEVFGAFDESGVLQGVTMWNEPGGKGITAKNVLLNGMLGSFLKLMFHMRPGSFYRMLKMSDCTQVHHPSGEHWYLYWITAFHPGAGSALMTDAIERFHGYEFYLENSNPAKNNRFYTKFGFAPLPEISWHGCAVLPMLRKAKQKTTK